MLPQAQVAQSHADLESILGDRSEGGSGCVFFVISLDLFYVVEMPQGCARYYTLMHPQQIGYRQKALDESKKPVGAYKHPCLEMKEIKQKERDF
jgi:hypothetical protein